MWLRLALSVPKGYIRWRLVARFAAEIATVTHCDGGGPAAELVRLPTFRSFWRGGVDHATQVAVLPDIRSNDYPGVWRKNR
jgi:hypothetical protein